MHKNTSEKEEEEFYDKYFKKYILIFFLFIFLVLFLPLLLTWDEISIANFNTTGPIGDTIGGIMGPFIAIAAAFLTFLAFWAQYKANLSQVKQFGKQAQQFQVDRFETRFFELLKIHRDNVNQLRISDNIAGNTVFEHYYNEFKVLYGLIVTEARKTCQSGISCNEIFNLDEYSKIEEFIKLITELSYCCFFSGYSQEIFKNCDSIFITNINNRIETAEIRNKTKKNLSLKFNLWDKARPGLFDENKDYTKLAIDYVYDFSGRQQNLGNYYRHLFLMVKYVVNQEDTFLNFDQKYEYIKIIRCQLSNYEQVMLYYNGISRLGIDWLNNGYITEWRILKNIPSELLSFGTSYNDVFESLYNSKGKHIFGWD